ncbi:hypothetical protein [Paenibacillus kandeliae]|uniref:hypothetical protein n=1 Tax=Paenibacillus kandeliae TaxID=3231269 RepID=UPI003457C889
MKRIKLALEYKCYPIWIYDEYDQLIDNNIVDELVGESYIVDKLDEIQAIYNHLFVDDTIQFQFKGFNSLKDKEHFLALIHEIVPAIEQKLIGQYKIQNKLIL